MISIIRIFFITSLLALSACGNNSFTLEFNLPPQVNTNYTVTYHASDKRGGITVETVAAVLNGKAMIKGTTVNPAIIYISSPGKQDIALYVERGDKIKISGNSTNPFSWDVKGNKTDEMLTAWRLENQDVLSKGDAGDINRAVAAYVRANPSSHVAALLLLTTFSRLHDEALFRSLWLSLDEDARQPKWVNLVARADQPGMNVTTPGKLKSIAVRSLHHGVDTIRTDSTSATLLFFWHSSFPDRKEYIDSIKSLSEEFTDSASRVIADICLEADSIAWRAPLKSDSISNVIRGWLPAGMADSRLINLSVPRAPFYIVCSSDGFQKYRGDNTSDAFATFRSLMRDSTKNDKRSLKK